MMSGVYAVCRRGFRPLLFLACVCCLQAQSIQREAFPSGLTLVVAERHTTPVVVVQAMVRAGPEHEGPLLGTGVSALVQRVMVNHPTSEVKAAERRTGNQFEYETQVGYASFRLRTTAEHVDHAIRAMALLLRGEGIDEAALQRERERLLLEQEQAGADPRRLAEQMVNATVYQHHAARLPIIGRRDALLALQLSDIERYRRRRYTSPNLVILVVGNVNTDAVRESVRSSFAYFPEGSFDRQPQIFEPAQLAAHLRVVPARLPVEQVFLAWRTVPMDHPDQAVLPLLARLLNAPGSPLRRSLEAEGRAGNVQVRHIDGLGFPGYLQLRYEVRSEQRNEALKAVNEAVAALGGEGGISEERLQTIKLRMRREYLAGDAVTQADQLGRWELAVGEPAWGERLFERQGAVTQAQISMALTTYLQGNRLSRVTLRPLEAGAAAAAGGAPIQPYASVPAEVSTCENGLRLVTQNAPRGLVQVMYSLGGAAAIEEEHVQGATWLLGRLLGRASEGHDAEALRRLLEAHGMELSVDADLHGLHLSITCFPEDVELAVGILGECLLQPVLDLDQVELAKQQTLERLALTDQLASWSQRLRDSMRRTLLEGHYASRSLSGSRQSVGNLDREVLRQQLKRMLIGGNLVVTVVGGPFDRARLQAVVAAQLGDPQRVPLGEALRPVGPAWPEGELVPVQVQLNNDREEAALGLAWRAPGRDAPLAERASMDVLAAMLGGVSGQGGRLGAVLRRSGEGSVLESLMETEAYDRRGLLMLEVLVAEVQRDAVRKQILAELARLLDELNAESPELTTEIAAAQAVCLTRASLLYEDLGQFATALAETLLGGEGVMEHLGYREAVRAVSRAQLLEMARRSLGQPACRVQLTPPVIAPEPVDEHEVRAIIDGAVSGGRPVVKEGAGEAVVVPGAAAPVVPAQPAPPAPPAPAPQAP